MDLAVTILEPFIQIISESEVGCFAPQRDPLPRTNHELKTDLRIIIDVTLRKTGKDRMQFRGKTVGSHD